MDGAHLHQALVSIRHRQTALGVSAWVVLIAASAIVSVSLAMLVLFVFVCASAIRTGAIRGQVMDSYALALPVMALSVTSLVCVFLGLPPGWGFILLLALASVILAYRLWSKGGLCFESDPIPPIALSVPILSMVIIRIVSGERVFSWLMLGDALPEFDIVTQLAELQAFESVPQYMPFSTTLHNHVALSLAETVSLFHTPGLATTLESFVAIVVVAVTLAFAQLHSAFGQRGKGLVVLGQGLAMGILLSSSSVLGMSASNGFINLGLATFLYSVGLVSVARLHRWRQPSDLFVGTFATVLLIATWPPLSLIVAGGLVGVWLFGKNVTRVALGGSIAIVTTALILSRIEFVDSRLPDSSIGSGYISMTPLAGFLLVLVILWLISGSNAYRDIFFAVPILVGSAWFAAAITIGNGQFLEIMADSYITSSTAQYYVLKFAWYAFLPFVMIVLILASSPVSFEILGRRVGSAVVVVLLAALVMLGNNPNMPWLPVESRSYHAALSRFAVDSSIPTVDPSSLANLSHWIEFCAREDKEQYCWPDTRKSS